MPKAMKLVILCKCNVSKVPTFPKNAIKKKFAIGFGWKISSKSVEVNESRNLDAINNGKSDMKYSHAVNDNILNDVSIVDRISMHFLYINELIDSTKIVTIIKIICEFGESFVIDQWKSDNEITIPMKMISRDKIPQIDNFSPRKDTPRIALKKTPVIRKIDKKTIDETKKPMFKRIHKIE